MSSGRAPSDEALAWLALGLVPGLGPRGAHALVGRLGTPQAVLGATAAELAEARVPAAVAHGLAGALDRAAREHRRIAAAGAALVAWSDPAYPARLRQIADPPTALTVRGTLRAEDEVAIAIVGARHASEYGRRMATELARGLTLAGVTVVSGLAAGIDAAAHRGALDARGRTIALLGTGIDVVYPPWHGELTGAVAARGALVTEFRCGADAEPHHFPRRNRLISGMTLGTIVVEAEERSGSLITARCALEQGREVFAVPGPAGQSRQAGPHRLIREGAALVTGVEDVIAVLMPSAGPRLAAARAAAAAATLTPIERRVLEAIGSEGHHVDDVIRAASVAPGPALETLLALELRGLVHQLPGKRFRRAA